MPSATVSPAAAAGLPGVTVSGTPVASQTVVASASNAASWAYPPGFEIGYDQITSSISITGTTSGAATTVITCAAHTFDGAAVMLEVFAPFIAMPTVIAGVIDVGLFESGSLITVLGECRANQTANQDELVFNARLRFTPTAAAHTYTIQAWTTSTTGTPAFVGGAGTAGALAPAFARFTKV